MVKKMSISGDLENAALGKMESNQTDTETNQLVYHQYRSENVAIVRSKSADNMVNLGPVVHEKRSVKHTERWWSIIKISFKRKEEN